MRGLRGRGLCQRTAVSGRRLPAHVGCLVLDVNMPGISGIDVLRRLREEGNMVPAIVVTGQPNSALRDGAMSAGALAFLDKPVIDGRLIDLISQAMDRP